MRTPRLRFVAALLLVLSIGAASSLSAQGPFSAQIQLAFQQLGLWPFGIYANGSIPTFSTAVNRFVPSSGSGATIVVAPSTCAAPSIAEAGAVTTGIAFTATPSILNCVSGTARSTLTASSLTLTVPALLPDGVVGAPALSFANETNSGFYRQSANVISLSIAANLVSQWTTARYISPAQISISDSLDVLMNREGAGHWFQRNSTNAQRLSVANTYTGATNYEAFSVDWQTTANVATVGTRTAATGTGRSLFLVSQATNAGNIIAGIKLNGNTAPVIQGGYFQTNGGQLSDSGTGTYFQWGIVTNTATSGSVVNTSITPTYNQSSGTAANTDLLINRTQTAVGSGAQLLIDAQVSTASKFSVDNAGSILATGSILGGNSSFIGLTSNFTLQAGGGTGLLNITNSASTTGIGVNVAGDGKLKFVSRFGGAGAATQITATQTTVPTCTAANNCGTGNGTFATGSSDVAGSVTLGTTPASGFIITFNGTWTAAPTCVVWMNKAGMAAGKAPLTSVTTTTTITVVTNGVAPATGDIYAYHCIGLQ